MFLPKILSTDELLYRLDELNEARTEGEDYQLNQIIAIEEMLLRKFSKEIDGEYSFNKTKRDLITGTGNDLS